jgi:hypothetical protein
MYIQQLIWNSESGDNDDGDGDEPNVIDDGGGTTFLPVCILL